MPTAYKAQKKHPPALKKLAVYQGTNKCLKIRNVRKTIVSTKIEVNVTLTFLQINQLGGGWGSSIR